MHKLLERQLKRAFGSLDAVPPDVRGFVASVNDAYEASDEGRRLTDRSLELMSAELVDRNAQLRQLRAEEDLRRQRQDFRELIESVPDAIMVRREDRWVFVNQAAVDCLGYQSPSELCGTRLLDVVHPDDVAMAASRVLSVDERRPVHVPFEMRFLRKDGGSAILEIALVRSIGFDGEPAVLLVARDVTEHKKLQSRLRLADRMASVGSLAAGVAHEINTPLQFVGDSVQFLEDAMRDLSVLIDGYRLVQQRVLAGEPATEAARGARRAEEAADLPDLLEQMPKALARALDGLHRVSNIVRSMKEFAHPGQTEMALADLNQAILSTLTVARNEYKYIAELETDLGELPRIMCRLGDVNQAILNLIVNAAHAIGDVVEGKGEKGRITVRTRRAGEFAVISIGDTGGGIPQAIRERIFDPFFTTKEVGRGTGQGLAIARSAIVEQHHGELTFETQLGAGTTFFIRLPLDQPVTSRTDSGASQPAR